MKKTPLLYPAGKCLPLELELQGALFFMPPERLDDPAFLDAESENLEAALSAEDLRTMIQRARSADMQDDQAMFYPGLHRFSVPIREQGKVVMTVGVGVSSKRTREGNLAAAIISELEHLRSSVEACFA